MGTWEEKTMIDGTAIVSSGSLRLRAVVAAAVVALMLLATAYFASSAARPMERPDMIPIRWSGDLAV